LSESPLHAQRWVATPESVIRLRIGFAMICLKVLFGAIRFVQAFFDLRARAALSRWAGYAFAPQLVYPRHRSLRVADGCICSFSALRKKVSEELGVRLAMTMSGSLRACGSLSLAFAAMLAATPASWAAEPGSMSIPIEVSPEGVQALLSTNQPFLLVDAEQPGGAKVSAGVQIRYIYYTRSPSFRAARVRAVQDRGAAYGASQDAVKFASQRLTGTPLDWRRLGLKFSLDPLPGKALELTPLQLSEALKDGADLQVVDLRPTSDPATPVAPFAPEALRLMPHQVEAELPKLSKQRWLVFVDGGDGIGASIAQASFSRGYPLATSLKGGYPAWAAATDR
jgi:rhodanese-related sulfurtransferase